MRQYEESDEEFLENDEHANRLLVERLDIGDEVEHVTEGPKNGFLMMNEIREALRDESSKDIITRMGLIPDYDAEKDELFVSESEDSEPQWDCQTILCMNTK